MCARQNNNFYIMITLWHRLRRLARLLFLLLCILLDPGTRKCWLLASNQTQVLTYM